MFSVNKINVTGIVLLLIPLVIPDYFQQIGIINGFFILLTGIIFFYSLFITFFRKRLNFFVAISIVFISWRSFSSFYFSDGVLDLVNSLRILTLILLINLTIKKFPKSTLNALSIVFGFFIIFNFVTYFMFPQGLYTVDNSQPAWILGIENQFGFFIIPGILIVILNSWFKSKKVSLYALFVILISSITLLKVWSATAIVAIFFVVFSAYLNLRRSIKPIYSFINLVIIYTIVWLILVRYSSTNVFETIIVNFLDKDLTLSGRTRIWEAVFESIPYSMWNGFGINSEVLGGVVTYFAAHNMILQIILDIGVNGLFLFIICLIIPGLMLQKFKSNRISALLLIGVFGILIGGLAESYRLNYLFLLLVLSYNIRYLIKSQSKIINK